jgi:hypothetical protein
MEIFGAILAAFANLAVLYTFLLLARLSRRLGAVTHAPPHYRGFYLSLALGGVGLLAHFLRASTLYAPAGLFPLLEDERFYLWTHHLALCLSALIAMAVTLYYWGWLLREHE